MHPDLPTLAGAYILVLEVTQTCLLDVGRLGCFVFPAGVYAYLGQAAGPGGLRARLGRHLRGTGRGRWHIDALRSHARPRAWGWCTPPWDTDHRPWECIWAQALAACSGVTIPAPGFGASDCGLGCPAHLVYLGPLPNPKALLQACLGETFPPHWDHI